MKNMVLMLKILAILGLTVFVAQTSMPPNRKTADHANHANISPRDNGKEGGEAEFPTVAILPEEPYADTYKARSDESEDPENQDGLALTESPPGPLAAPRMD